MVQFDRGYRVLTMDMGTATSSGYLMCEVTEDTKEAVVGVEKHSLTEGEKAALARGDPVVLTFDQGDGSGKRERLVPSVVDFGEGGPHVGAQAKGNLEGGNVAYLAKRLIGLSLEEAREKHPDLCERFNLTAKDNTTVYFNLENGTRVTPADVMAHIAESLVAEATRKAGAKPTWVAASVPAYFAKNQRQITQEYLQTVLPGNVHFLGLLDEPTAAALAYGADSLIENSSDEKRLFNLVVDLGGGTFDVSLVEYKCATGGEELHVFDKRGDIHLGGRDFDLVVKGLFEERLLKKRPEVAELDEAARKSLDTQVEEARKFLSSKGPMGGDYTVTVHILGKRTTAQVTRRDFVQCEGTKMLLGACEKLVGDLLHQDGLGSVKLDEIDTVILVGGASYMHPFREAIARKLEMQASDLKSLADPETAVALGCMNWALSEIKKKKGDAQDPKRFQARDAVDAMPPIVQEKTHFKLVEYLPFPLGVACQDEYGNPDFGEIIAKGGSYDAEGERVFYTVDADATEVAIKVREGDEHDVAKFEDVHEFRITGIPPKSHGYSGAIRINFKMTETRELKVKVVVIDSKGRPPIIETVKRGGLNYTPAEVEQARVRMGAQAEARKLAEKKRTLMEGVKPILEEVDLLIQGNEELLAELNVLRQKVPLIQEISFDLPAFVATLSEFLEKARDVGPSTVEKIEGDLKALV